MSDIVGTLTIASTDISGTLTTDETTISVTLNTGGASVVGTVSLVGATGPQGIQGADGLGVPSGGTTAQVLAKASNTDNDTEWINNTGGGGGGGDALVANPLSQFAATTKAQLNGVISDGTPLYVGDAPTAHTHVAADVTDFDTEVSNNTAVAANTAKVSNVAHPLVETAVPVGAVFTDTVYNDTAIQAEVDANTAKTGITAQQASDIVTNNAKVTYDDAAAVAANTAKVGVTTELKPTDIDTLAELNAIITDATLIDTADARLSDARTPTAHTHTASDVTDFDAEVSNNPDVSTNTAKVSADGSVGTHSDVDLTGIADGDVPTWVAANARFEPSAPSGGGGPVRVHLSSDFVVTNDNSTSAEITDFRVVVPATKKAVFTGLLYVETPFDVDARIRVTSEFTSTLLRYSVNNSASKSRNFVENFENNSGNGEFYTISGMTDVNSFGFECDLIFQFGQKVADARATALIRGSFLEYEII